MTTLPPHRLVEPVVLPPTYDEAVGNVSSEQIQLDISNVQNLTHVHPVDEFSKKETEDEEEAKKKQLLNNAQPPIVTQPQIGYTVLPSNQQSGTVYNFSPSHPQIHSSNDCVVCCYMCNSEDITNICYCLFCCRRHTTNDECGDNCDCDNCCPDGCCECGDCDCGDCDCDCDCGDCTII